MLGERLRAQREHLGLSQEEAALACGVHWGMLSQIERGQRNITLHSLLRLAYGLEIDPSKLVRGLKPPEVE
jgi:transcriptional regulator with XRE-family HTH domain